MATTSTMPDGTTRKTDTVEDIWSKILNKDTEQNNYLSILAKATAGDQGVAKKILDIILKGYQLQEEDKKLKEKFGDNFKEMIKYVKAIQTDTTLKTEKKAINKDVGRDIAKLQNKGMFSALADALGQDNALYQMVTGRYVNLPGSEKLQKNKMTEDLKRGYSGLAGQADERAYDRYIDSTVLGSPSSLKQTPIDIDMEESEIGRERSLSRRKSRLLSKGMDTGFAGTGSGAVATGSRSGSSLVIEKYGKGKLDVTEGQIAQLPFMISAPPLLIHQDFKELLKYQKVMADTAEWDLAKKEGGGGGLESIISGVLTATGLTGIPMLLTKLGGLSGILSGLAKTIPVLGLIVGSAAGVFEIFNNKSKLGGTGGSFVGGLAETLSFGLLKKEGIESSFQGFNTKSDLLFAKLGDKLFGTDSATINEETLFINGRHMREFNDLKEKGKTEEEARKEILKKYNFSFLKKNGAFDNDAFIDYLSKGDIASRLSINSGSKALDNFTPLPKFGSKENPSPIDSSKLSFDVGGKVPGSYKGQPVPVLAHAGETIFPTHKDNFSRDIQYLVDNAQAQKRDDTNSKMLKQMQAMVEKFEELIKINEKGNTILENKELKAPQNTETSRDLPVTQAKVSTTK